MSALPVVSGLAAIRAFETMGYTRTRTRGSHCQLHHSDSSRQPLSVPLHSELDRGTLRSLIRKAGMTVEEFVAALG